MTKTINLHDWAQVRSALLSAQDMTAFAQIVVDAVAEWTRGYEYLHFRLKYRLPDITAEWQVLVDMEYGTLVIDPRERFPIRLRVFELEFKMKGMRFSFTSEEAWAFFTPDYYCLDSLRLYIIDQLSELYDTTHEPDEVEL